MQREEKQLEASLETILLRVNDLKNSIAAMIFKLENESDNLNWPTFLDNFALISSQVILNYISFFFLRFKTILSLNNFTVGFVVKNVRT